MATIYQTTRRTSGAAGPPASLRSGQMFYNMMDGKLYIGKGDNGSGVATSIMQFADDTFSETGTVLTEGNGIDITGDVISVDAATIPNIAAGKITGTLATGNIPALDAAKITTGTFDAARIPALDAGKITTGTFTVAQIPALPTSKITSGTFGNAFIADLDAAKLTGTIDIARLPVLPGTVQIVSSGSIANLTAPQQAEIGDGSVVTTTDGRRWIYSGSGSKTAEASYIEMADITPDWSVIAGKPTFHAVATSGSYTDLTNRPALATVATSGSYADLTNKPTLGTMAAQNANAVAITGGTIDGVILDGGTL